MLLPDIDPQTVPADEIPATLARLAAMQLALTARLLDHSANHQEPQVDQMLSIEEVSQRIDQTPDWIKRHAKRLPFLKRISRKKWLASEAGLNKWLAPRKA